MLKYIQSSIHPFTLKISSEIIQKLTSPLLKYVDCLIKCDEGKTQEFNILYINKCCYRKYNNYNNIHEFYVNRVKGIIHFKNLIHIFS